MVRQICYILEFMNNEFPFISIVKGNYNINNLNTIAVGHKTKENFFFVFKLLRVTFKIVLYVLIIMIILRLLILLITKM